MRGQGRERGRRRGYQRAQQREHLQKQSSLGEARRGNLTKESDLQLREGWAALCGQSGPAVGGGGMKEKEMERGEGQEEGEGAVPSNSMVL